jgi:amidase
MQHQPADPLYFETGPANRPTLRVASGEEYEIQTQLNRGPWFDTHPEGERLRKLLRGGNPSSGCVYVEGAKPGGMLSIEIGPIALDPLGFTNYRGSNGAFPGWCGVSGIGACHKVVEIRDGRVLWSPELTLAARPMLGFVGVSSEFETFGNTWCTRYGGNFDVQEITTGATVHLPVAVEGALLHIGDMHAIQGDGEICGAGGIEASGLVRVTPRIADMPPSMTWPRITNAEAIMVATQAKPAEDAFRLGLEEMVKWLAEDYGFTPQEAYLYLGQVLEARATQFVNPTFTYLLKVRREHLPRCRTDRAW